MIRNQRITVDAVLMMQRIRLMIQAPPLFFQDPHFLSFSSASGNTTGAVNSLWSNLLHEKSGFHRIMYRAATHRRDTLHNGCPYSSTANSVCQYQIRAITSNNYLLILVSSFCTIITLIFLHAQYLTKPHFSFATRQGFVNNLSTFY